MARWLGIAWVALCCLVGCGQGGARVSGTATFEGKPIPKGTITFLPDSSKSNSGQAGFAAITDGKYDTANGGKGFGGGAAVVKIEGFDGVAIDEERPNGKPLFGYYEVQIELPKSSSTKDFDVPAAAVDAKQPAGPMIVVP